ncbi:DNA-binding response regulator [Noviherbaspirillum saxi]|uniref:DNA-binding response regulator n=2 Tax=Noviherbaspirillum saxi TaxID=2320863 RepID=A0A3A3FHG4_9BURK|nr:DNA-binding response regulator [Noviherbaspirillum saxi]
MLVDDHGTMVWGLQKLIEGAPSNMTVVGTAKTCREALDGASRFSPDIILLDLDLGGEDAVDIIQELQTRFEGRILVLTGTRDRSQLDKAVLRGARGVLSKDAPAEQVLRAIEKVHQGQIWVEQEMLGRVLGELMNPSENKSRSADDERIALLTSRENNIVRMLVEHSGAPNKAIAERLFISEHTLRNHLTSIYRKLGVSSRLELYVYAVKHQIDSQASAPSARPTTGNHLQASFD